MTTAGYDALHYFDQSASFQSIAFNSIAGPVDEAAGRLVQCLLGGGKIISCGTGDSAALAQLLTSKLVNRFDQERPSFPAISLGLNPVTMTAISDTGHYGDVFAKQIRSLGAEQDLLVVLSTSGQSSPLIQAVQAAHDRAIPVVALTGFDGGDISRILNSGDLEVRIECDAPVHIHEIHYIVINCICRLIDHQIFGH